MVSIVRLTWNHSSGFLLADCAGWLTVLIILTLASSNISTGFPAEKESQLKLELVTILHRHGNRSPNSRFAEYDEYLKPEYWPDGQDQLLKAGKEMMYQLGQALRSRYQNFLTQSPREVYARSSDSDRCIESGQLVLHGLYKAQGRWIYDNDSDYLPIPIHTVPNKYDCTLSADCDCPFTSKWTELLDENPEIKVIRESFSKTIDYLVNENNLTSLNSMIKMSWFYLALKFSTDGGYPLPEYMKPEIYTNLSRLNDAVVEIQACSTEILGLRVTNFFQEILNQFQAKTSKDSNDGEESKRLLLYSSHDTLIAAILCGLNIFNSKAPPIGSTLILELFSISNPGETANQYFVKHLYWNETYQEEPYVLRPKYCNGSDLCSLEDFVANLRSIMIPDWRQKCSLCDGGDQRNATLITLAGIIIVLIVIIIGLSLFLRQRKDPEDYDPLD